MDKKSLLHFTKMMKTWEDNNFPADQYSGQKDAFRRWSQAFLRQVAQDTGMAAQAFKVSFNSGGIAVSGDADLHHTKVHIFFNADQICKWICYRTCKGMKDYTGGVNQQAYWKDLQTIEGYENFIVKIMAIINKGE